MDNKFIGYIYKTTIHNSESELDGCYYYGQHYGEKAFRYYPNPDPFYFGSGTIIQNYIKKYGKKGLEVSILGWYSTPEELNLAEESIVGDKFNSDCFCLNR